MANIQRALISVTDKAGLVDFAKALAGFGVELALDRGDGQAATRRGAEGRPGVRLHRPAGDPRRSCEDAAPQGAWRPLGDPRQRRAPEAARRARVRPDRHGRRQPLPVRSHRREAAGDVRRRDREHRHRRPGDDPFGGEESRFRHRDRRSRRLREACATEMGATRRRGLGHHESRARQEGLSADRALRRGDRRLPGLTRRHGRRAPALR